MAISSLKILFGVMGTVFIGIALYNSVLNKKIARVRVKI